MPIVTNLDVMLAKRKMSLTELSERIGITMANLSILKKGKAKAIRFSTLHWRLFAKYWNVNPEIFCLMNRIMAHNKLIDKQNKFIVFR